MEKDQIIKEPQTIFLIGAGASVHFGIPAMQSMLNDFMDNHKSGISTEQKKLCQFLVKEIGVKEDLEEFLLAANTIIEFEATSLSKLIERTISRKENASQVLNYKGKLSNYVKDVRLLRKLMLQYVSNICFRFDRSKAEQVLCGFIKAIAKCGYPVYTTNYDYIFEHVAQGASIKINDNFTQQKQRSLWDSQIDFPTGNALTIIKLHGSVTWYADKNGVIEKIYFDTSTNPVGDRIERVVVFPTRFKDIYDQHFFALYSHFLSALSSAKCLVVIGHSLRDEYLRAGIIERYRKGGFQIIIINPQFPNNLPKEMTPAKIGLSGEITHIPYHFEQFSDEIANVILNVGPVDIAKECAEIVHYAKSKKNKIKIKGMIGTLKSNTKKTFNVSIDAYLQPHERPAYVRVWLNAKYQKDNEPKDEVTGVFLEDEEVKIATELSGMVKTELSITIKVPKIPDWFNYSDKVTLSVGILGKNIKQPSLIVSDNILAKDIKKLKYRNGE